MIKAIPNYFKASGYEIYSTRYADSILQHEFSQAYSEIDAILEDFSLVKRDFTDTGGGLAKLTQRLRNQFEDSDWKKNVKTETITDGISTYAESHEIDHFKDWPNGAVGLEIEWNNKPTFFDRDLANFRFLHRVNIIGLGVIICRGTSIQEMIYDIFKDVFRDLTRNELNAKEITSIQSKAIGKYITNGLCINDAFAKKLSNDKYASSTTHMRTLIDSVKRGIGDPCPLVLIGIGKDRIVDL